MSVIKNQWWARQDSNLQPDRYERSALTIELQAPPALAGNGAVTPYNDRCLRAIGVLVYRPNLFFAGNITRFRPLIRQ